MTWFWTCPECTTQQYYSPGDHIQHVGRFDVRWCHVCRFYFTESGAVIEEERIDTDDYSVLVLRLRDAR